MPNTKLSLRMQVLVVAHLLMLRAIATAKKKNDRIDAGKIADCLRCDFLPECHMASTAIQDRRCARRAIAQRSEPVSRFAFPSELSVARSANGEP